MKLKLSLIFSWFIDHKKRYPNNEDSNYIRNPFTSPTFTKKLTSPTRNEIAHKGSEFVHAKIKKSSKAALLNHSKFHPVYFSYSLLCLSSLALKKLESKTK